METFWNQKKCLFSDILNAKQASSTWYDISWIVGDLQVGKTEHDTEQNGRKWDGGGLVGGEEAWDSNERCSRGRGKKNVSKELLTGDLEALESKRDLVAAKCLFY